MTRAELIETCLRLLVLSGARMGDLAPTVIERVDDFGKLASRADQLRRTSNEFKRGLATAGL